MAKTSNVFARIDPGLKEQAESILEQLGVSMSGAINMFLRQIVIQRGVPFEVKLPGHQLTDMSALSEAEFNAEMEIGMNDLRLGKVISADDVKKNFEWEYGI